MGRVFLFGVVLATLGALTVAIGAAAGINFQNVLVGITGGAVLGLIRRGSPVARVGAFLIGFFIGVAFYLLRISVLPSNWEGVAVAIFIITMLLTVIAALTKDRLPFWAMILGAMVFSAGYDSFFNMSPWFALTQIPMVIAATLATSSIGFLVTLVVELREKRGGVSLDDPMRPSPPVSPNSPELAVSAAGADSAATGGKAPGGTASRGSTNPGLQLFDGTQGGQA